MTLEKGVAKNKKIKVHFIHIGKTGGSVLKRTLRKGFENKKYFIILNKHSVKLGDIPKGEKVIFFVRDPIHRFVSGFYSRKREGKPLNNVPWSPGEKEAFKKFDTPNKIAEALTSKNISLKKSAIEAMNHIYHIKTNYWYWFKNKKYFISRLNDIIFVGCQEDLNKDFIQLKRILNLDKNIKLPTNKLEMHKNPSNIDKYISDNGKRNLMKWYHEDYKFLKVCFNKLLIKNRYEMPK